MSASLTTSQRGRWRAPEADGEALVEPPLSGLAETLEANRELAWPIESLLVDRSPQRLRTEARRELVQLALKHTRQYRDVSIEEDASSPLLLSGHQPELIHCGVWFKHFVLHEAARRMGGIGIHLSIDNDTAKRTAIVVPSGSAQEPRLITIPYDRRTTQVPYEDRRVIDQAAWKSFAARVAHAAKDLVPAPMVESYWARVLQHSERPLGEAIATARHQLEGSLGLQTLEVPLSRVCRGESFGWFLALLFGDFEQLHAAYNDALADYREVHRLRSSQHPVPNLGRRGPWWELPLWLWTVDEPTRRRCYVRRVGKEVIVSDLKGCEYRLPQHAEGASSLTVSAIVDLQQTGVRLRPRALATTLFARWMLGDLFIHGIGGAVYDQVTDQIAQRWWKAPPGEFMVATATFRLPVPRPDISSDDLRRIRQQLRQLEFHPELFVSDSSPGVREWIERKRHWIATDLPRGSRRERHLGIAEANRALQQFVVPLRKRLTGEETQVQRLLRVREILDSREYAFCLFPHSHVARLAQAAQMVLPDRGRGD